MPKMFLGGCGRRLTALSNQFSAGGKVAKMAKLGGKVAKLGKLIRALMAAGCVQGGQDGQVVLWGAAAAARAVEQESVRSWRGRRHSAGYIAILMAEAEPMMRACYLIVKEHCSADLNRSLVCYREAVRAIRALLRQEVEDLDPRGMAETFTGPYVGAREWI